MNKKPLFVNFLSIKPIIVNFIVNISKNKKHINVTAV